MPPSETLQVDSPANDPFVTGVGGTAIEEPGVEPVWNDCGGLVGRLVRGRRQPGRGRRPVDDLQAAEVAAARVERDVFELPAGARHLRQRRGRRDVLRSSGNWTAVGGTSIAAPMMAGIAADIDQGCRGGRIGHFAPRLAALAAKRVYGVALTDVTTGINWNNFTIQTPGSNDLTRNHAGAYKTTKGFDLATGYGSPIASGLACPTVLSMTPNHGKAGARVTLHGVGLEKATIKFGSAKARVVSASAKSAVVIVPKGKGIVNVRGTSAFGTGVKAAPFSYLGPDRGLYRTVAADGHVYNFGGALGYGSPTSDRRARTDHRAWRWTTRPAATGSWPPTAPSTTSTHRSSATRAPGRSTSPSSGWRPTRPATATGSSRATAGSSRSGRSKFYGSTGGMHLNKPIVGIAANAETGGYWLVASDGGIFAFNAPFHGSTGAHAPQQADRRHRAERRDRRLLARRVRRRDLRVPRPVLRVDGGDRGSTGRSSAWPRPSDARGYRFVASDGGVFNFGDAKYGGSTGGAALTSPVVAISPVQ